MICDNLLACSTTQARTKSVGANFPRDDLGRGGHNDQDPVVSSRRGLIDGVVARRARGEPDIHSHSGAQDASSASKSPYAGNGSRGIELQPGAQDAGAAPKSPYAGHGPRGFEFHSVALMLISSVIVERGLV